MVVGKGGLYEKQAVRISEWRAALAFAERQEKMQKACQPQNLLNALCILARSPVNKSIL
jgi:hypothetical protein